jgi:hypothetical protein
LSGINLNHAQTDFLISFDGSRIKGNFTAEGLRSESDLDLRNGAVFKSDMLLRSAKIDGNIDMTGASFDGLLMIDDGMAQAPKQPRPDIATRIMERMVRMPPKQHKEMKLGKRKAKDKREPPKKTD